jgi:hypothetical protein
MIAIFEVIPDQLSDEAIAAKVEFLTGDSIDLATYVGVRDALHSLVDKHVWKIAHALHHQHLRGENGFAAQAFLFDLAEELDTKLESVWQAAAARRAV